MSDQKEEPGERGIREALGHTKPDEAVASLHDPDGQVSHFDSRGNKIGVDRMESIGEVAARILPEPRIASAVNVIRQAMRDDPEYAWSWHCNIAMAFYDAADQSITNNLRHHLGNLGAARFMKLCFDVDTSRHPREYQEVPAKVEGGVLTVEPFEVDADSANPDILVQHEGDLEKYGAMEEPTGMDQLVEKILDNLVGVMFDRAEVRKAIEETILELDSEFPGLPNK